MIPLNMHALQIRYTLSDLKHRFFKKTFFRSSRLESIVTDASKFQTRVEMIFEIGRSLL